MKREMYLYMAFIKNPADLKNMEYKRAQRALERSPETEGF